MLTKVTATRFLSNTTQKARKKVDCAVYGCGLSASGALAIPKLIQGTSNSDDIIASEMEYPKRVTFFNTKSVKFVSSGFGFSLFASENRLYGAGINNRFQIGGQLTDSSKYQDYYISAKKISIPADEILEISSGRAHSLIRTSSGIFAIGDNNFGQCGRDPTATEYVVGSEESPLIPLDLPTNNPIISIHCSMDTSFLVDSTGQVFSFGLNEDGQCGNEEYGIQWAPRKVKGDVNGVEVQKVAGSTDTIMATSKEGEVFVWGQTEYGQAAGATEEIQLNTSRHLNISSSTGKISSIDTTQSSVIARNKNGEVFVWGVGVLGMGPEAEVLKRPVQMDQPLFDGKKVCSIAAGNTSMSAINESGRLFIWGENRYSSLGLGHSNRQLFPYQLFLPGDVREAALGPDHSLFLVN
uniref:RCC1/BLIP-II n=1 Tax=Caenorhabditis tropicalis TaxID=1561998 RepID=A0A1I7T730_9PELO